MAETMIDIKTFGGLNFGPHVTPNECAVCTNLDDANAPALRTARGFESVALTGTGTLQGAFVEDGEVIASVWNDTLYVSGRTFGLKTLGQPRRFLRISPSQVLILPDRYLLIPKTKQVRPFDNELSVTGSVVSYTTSSVTLLLYGRPPVDFYGHVYVDGVNHVYYDEETNPSGNLMYFYVSSVQRMDTGNYQMVLSAVWKSGEGSLTYIDTTTSRTFTVRQVVPELTNAVVCRNRLWGVAGKKLVASKLSNPLVFDDFSGLSTDSFELPMEAPLTTVSHFGERVVFMSKTHLYELYGDRPSNYQVSAAKSGGCVYPESVCNAGGYLVYADRDHIYRYGGGDPQPVSDRFEFPAWQSLFGVSDGETCLLGIDQRLFRYHPSQNTFYELPLSVTGGFVADSDRYCFNGTGLFRSVRGRSDEAFHYRSGWCNLDRLGRAAPKELVLHLDGAADHIALVTRDGEVHPLTAIDDRGDGLLRLPFPADLQNRVFAVELRGHGDACLHRITLRG